MKKILQRIGLLAAAVMLLWGWQGMEAKAAEDIFTFKCSSTCHIDEKKSHVNKNQDGTKYYLYLYPKDGYAFTQAPRVSLCEEPGNIQIGLFTAVEENGNPYYTYFILAEWVDPTYKYSININNKSEVTWEKWNDWTINRDKLENGHIAKGYGLSGSAAESHDAHLFLYVEPKDGYYFTEEPKVSWNDTLLVPLPKDSSTLYGYKYQLDDNGKGTIFVEGKAVKKDTAEPQANTSQSSNDTYKIINGARSTWNGSTTEGLTIRGDGDFAKFAGVRVDGNWIPSAHYEAKSGSTIVTLKPSYLASLAEGEHTVDIMWIDDSASTTFTVTANTVAAQPELDSVPKTGEGILGWMPEVLLLAAAGLVTFGGLLRRRSKIHL